MKKFPVEQSLGKKDYRVKRHKDFFCLLTDCVIPCASSVLFGILVLHNLSGITGRNIGPS